MDNSKDKSCNHKECAEKNSKISNNVEKIGDYVFSIIEDLPTDQDRAHLMSYVASTFSASFIHMIFLMSGNDYDYTYEEFDEFVDRIKLTLKEIISQEKENANK